MVKIFVGNLPREADQDEIKELFTTYGTVTECAIIKNYAFVHMDDRKAATKAIKNLHLYKLHGTPINVEASHGKNQGSVKLHVANVEKGSDDELRALFEEYGSVTECAVVKNFAFVHMSNSDEAMDAIKGLDNSEFQGEKCFDKLRFCCVKYLNEDVITHISRFIQANTSMSRFLKADPDTMNEMTTPLHPQIGVATGPLAIQETGMSLPLQATWEVASATFPQVTLLPLCLPLPLEEPFILNVPMKGRGTGMVS